MNIGPCVFFGGVKWSLVSMMVIISHDLLAADLVFEDLWFQNITAVIHKILKTSFHPQGCGTKKMCYVDLS